MSGIEKLHLEDAFEDSPQMRSLVALFEKDSMILKDYTSLLHQACTRMLNAQRELSLATQSLSSLLKVYDRQNFPLESDDSIFVDTMKQFTVYLDEFSSYNQIMATQLSDSMMYPLNKFLQADLGEIVAMCETYKFASQEHEQAMIRYSKLSKKKDNPKQREEGNEDLYVYRKKFHQTALHYYTSLNAVQYKRRSLLLEPLVSFMQALRTFCEMSNDSFLRTNTEDFVSNIRASIQEINRALEKETEKTVKEIQNIEMQSDNSYYPNPMNEAGQLPPQLSLYQKASYLFYRMKPSLIHASKWELCYFFIQGGHLMCQLKDEVAGSSVLDLNEPGTRAEPADYDDRRFVFQVTSGGKKTVIVLQAECERERDEWIATINNVVAKDNLEREEHSGRSGSVGSDSSSSAAIAKQAVRNSANPRSSFPPTPPSTPLESSFFQDVPIQFDLPSPGGEEHGRLLSDSSSSPHPRSSADVGDSFYEKFPARFLGSMAVPSDRGEFVVNECIRQIMTARAIQNFFKTTDVNVLVTGVKIRILNSNDNFPRAEFKLEDVSYWSTHKESPRLFGFITRDRSFVDRPHVTCNVFECNTSGEEICSAIDMATRAAFQSLVERKTSQHEEYLRGGISSWHDTITDSRAHMGGPSGDVNQIVSPPVNQPPVNQPTSSESHQERGGVSEQIIAPPPGTTETIHVEAKASRTSDQPDGESTSPDQVQTISAAVVDNCGDGDERKVEGAESKGET